MTNINKTSVKQLIRDNNMNSSPAFLQELDVFVYKHILRCIERAEENKRKTLMKQDV